MPAVGAIETIPRVRELFEQHGLGDAFKAPRSTAVRILASSFQDPALLAEILSRYEALSEGDIWGFGGRGRGGNAQGLRKAFEEFGFSDLFEASSPELFFLLRS